MFIILCFSLILFSSSLKKEGLLPNYAGSAKFKTMFEQYKQLRYLQDPFNSDINKLILIQNSSFLNLDSKLKPNYLKGLDF